MNKLVVGIAVDVSGSMKKSSNQAAAASEMRYERLRAAVTDFCARLEASPRPTIPSDDEARLFITVFGLSEEPGVADLLALLRATDAELTESKVQSAVNAAMLEELAFVRMLLGGSFAGTLETLDGHLGKLGFGKACKERIRAGVRARLAEPIRATLNEEGPIVAGASELPALWSEGRSWTRYADESPCVYFYSCVFHSGSATPRP